MFIELIDALRCPRTHEESWLVLASTHTVVRHIQEGTLGCPVCHAEYPIHDGIADFRLSHAGTSGLEATSSDAWPSITEHVSADHLAAMLNLGDALGFAVLTGDWARLADGLLEMGNPPPLLLVDPPEGSVMAAGLSGLRAGAALPLAAGAARAIAVDGTDETRLASAAHTTRATGRIVAPARAHVPAGVRELVRDDTLWVGEREAPPAPLVRLHVRRG